MWRRRGSYICLGNQGRPEGKTAFEMRPGWWEARYNKDQRRHSLGRGKIRCRRTTEERIPLDYGGTQEGQCGWSTVNKGERGWELNLGRYARVRAYCGL